MKKRLFIAVFCTTAALLAACAPTQTEPTNPDEFGVDAKPVIYLYPEVETEVSVTLAYDGDLLYTYPAYEDGWLVTAHPDGSLYHEGREYTYLFWEGVSDAVYDLSKGFVVKGEDTEDFLVETLAYLGLTPKEYNEFIVYWLPRMVGNEYNLISFQTDAYTESATLQISPQPDSIQRVFMAFQSLDEEIVIEEQVLTPFAREGFCVIEWGGTEVKGR